MDGYYEIYQTKVNNRECDYVFALLVCLDGSYYQKRLLTKIIKLFTNKKIDDKILLNNKTKEVLTKWKQE